MTASAIRVLDDSAGTILTDTRDSYLQGLFYNSSQTRFYFMRGASSTTLQWAYVTSDLASSGTVGSSFTPSSITAGWSAASDDGDYGVAVYVNSGSTGYALSRLVASSETVNNTIQTFSPTAVTYNIRIGCTGTDSFVVLYHGPAERVHGTNYERLYYRTYVPSTDTLGSETIASVSGTPGLSQSGVEADFTINSFAAPRHMRGVYTDDKAQFLIVNPNAVHTDIITYDASAGTWAARGTNYTPAYRREVFFDGSSPYFMAPGAGQVGVSSAWAGTQSNETVTDALNNLDNLLHPDHTNDEIYLTQVSSTTNVRRKKRNSSGTWDSSWTDDTITLTSATSIRTDISNDGRFFSISGNTYLVRTAVTNQSSGRGLHLIKITLTAGSTTVTPNPVNVAISAPQATRKGGAGRTPTPVSVGISIPQATPVVPAAYQLREWRFRDHDNFTEPANGTGWGVAQDTPPTLDVGRGFRLRVAVAETTGSGAAGESFKLQYQINAGAWADVDVYSPGDADARTGGQTGPVEIRRIQSASLNDTATTQLLSSPDTFAAGQLKTSALVATASPGDGTPSTTEIEWALWTHRYWPSTTTLNQLADGDTITLRVQWDNSGYETISPSGSNPSLTVNIPAYNLGGQISEQLGKPSAGVHCNSSGHLYYIGELTEQDNQMVVHKSTDGGVSWAIQDFADGPTSHVDIEAMDSFIDPDGDELWIFSNNGTEVRMFRFGMSNHASADQWLDATGELVETISTPTDQSVSAFYRSGDSTVVCVYSYSSTTYRANIRTGGSWGTAFDLWTAIGGGGRAIGGVLLPTNDHVVVWARDNVADLYAKMINGTDDSLDDLSGGTQTAAANGDLIDDDMKSYGGWLGGQALSSTSFVIGYVEDADPQDAVTRVVTGVGSSVSVGAEQANINSGTHVPTDHGLSNQAAGTMVLHPVTGDLYAVYAREATIDAATNTFHYRISTDNGSTWGTEQTIAAASPGRGWGLRIENLTADIYERVGNYQLGVIYNDASLEQQDDFTATNPNWGGFIGGWTWFWELDLGPVVTPAPVSAAISLPQASAFEEVAGDATATPTDIDVAISLPQAVRTGAASRIPASVTVAVTLPQTQAGGSAKPVPDPISVAGTLPTPTRSGAALRTPASVAVAVTLPQATRTVSTTTTVEPVTIAVTIPSASRTGAALRTPTPAAVAIAVPQVTVVTTSNATTTPEPVLVSITLPQATPVTGTSTTTTPEPVLVSVTLPQASRSGAASHAATPILVAITLPGSTVDTTTVRTPTPMSVAVTLPTPTISLFEPVPVDPVSSTITLPTPTLSGTATVVPTPITVAITVPTPTILTEGAALVTPQAVTVAITVPQATISGVGNTTPNSVTVQNTLPQAVRSGAATRTPTETVVAITVPQATPVTGGDITVTPTPVTVAVTLPQTSAVTSEDATPTPTPVQVAVTVPQASRTAAASRTPTSVVVAISLPQASVVTTGAATVTPSPLVAAVSVPQTGWAGSALRLVQPVPVAISLPQTSAAGGSDTTVTATPIVVTFAVPQAAAAGGTGTVQTPTPIPVTLTPTSVVLSAGSVVIPDVPNVTVSLPGVSIYGELGLWYDMDMWSSSQDSAMSVNRNEDRVYASTRQEL